MFRNLTFLLNLSLRTKLIACFIILGTIPLVISGAISFMSSSGEAERKTGLALKDHAASMIDKIDRNLFERYGDAQAFAFNPMACDSAENITKAADFYMTAYGQYDLMIVADADGKIIATNTVDFEGKKIDTRGLIGRSVKDEEWFRSCINGRIQTGQSFSAELSEDRMVAEVYRSRGLAMNFAAPIRDETGNIVRVWSNRVSWDRGVRKIIEDFRKANKESGIDLETQIVSANGLVLDDADPKAVMKINLRDMGLDAAKFVTEGKSGFTTETHKRRNVLQINGYAQSKGFDTYKGFGWGVLVREDFESATNSVLVMKSKLYTVGGIAIAVLATVGFVLATLIVKPVRRMTTALQSIVHGNTTSPVEVISHDEIGQMSMAVNTMIEGIAKQRVLEKEVHQIKMMLDEAPINVMFADRDLVIRYINNTSVKTLSGLQKHLPIKPTEMIGQTIDIFHKNPGHQRKLLADPANLPVKSVISVGPEKLELLVTAVFDQNRQHIGAMVCWEVITEKLAMQKAIEDATEREKHQAMEVREKVGKIRLVVEAIAAGDFTQKVPDLGTDDVAEMGVALNRSVDAVREALTRVNQVADGLATASKELSSASAQISTGAQETASSLEQTASSLEQMTATVKQNSDSSQQARQLAMSSRDIAEKGGMVVRSAVDAMSEINKASSRIAEIISTIDEIAFQTNLLALNAAVEAARAGEQGRGFAVVAAEVRNLAQRSAGAAKEIKGLIQDSVRKVEAGSGLVNQSGQTLDEIVASVKKVTDIVSEIAAASREQTLGIDQINKAVTQMDRVTQGNAAQTEEMSSTSQELSNQADELQQLVNGFQLGLNRMAATGPAVKQLNPTANKPARKAPKNRIAAVGAVDGTDLDSIKGFDEF